MGMSCLLLIIRHPAVSEFPTDFIDEEKTDHLMSQVSAAD